MADAPFTRAERRASTRRRRIRRRFAVAVLLLLTGAAAGAVWAADPDVYADSDSAQPAPTRSAAARESRKKVKPTRPLRLASRAAGLLAAPVQDAAIATVGRRILLLGGLDAADVSTADVRVVAGGSTRTIAHLPRVFHDATAVALGPSVYVFGGGDGIRQLDQIVQVDPQTGAARSAGALPVPSSDSAAAALGGTAYVVGGYTGASWLSTIVAWRPGKAPRVVAHLPSPLRYAAVAAGNGRLVIAGGSLPSGAASRAVYSFDPRAASVRRIGVLPAPTTHAAAASLGKRVLVIGGRSARPGTPRDEIVSIEPLTGKIAAAGRLARAVSDAAVTTLGRVLVVVGGRGRATTAQVTRLVPVARAKRATHSARSAQALGVYAHDGANALSAVVRNMPARVYVPNSASNTVDVIDQRTFKIVAHYAVGRLPQHVTPSYDLKTLYVDNDEGNSLTPVSPFTGRPKGPPIPVSDPYNLYFTPSGRYAIVVAERNQRLDFRYAHTMRLHRSLRTPCRGVDHMDFSAGGRYLIASCEFSGQMLKVDVRRERVTGLLTLPHRGAMPQDVKLSPDGRVFYVADMASNGVWEIDGNTMRVIRFIHTGAGAHGLYPSRDSKLLYVTNRNEGTISVLDFATRRLVAKWDVGGSPDMGGVSADGNVLWLSGRYNAQVYAISTRDGRVLARIPVGYGPHGVCVWPQPGRYSLGHTGILR